MFNISVPFDFFTVFIYCVLGVIFIKGESVSVL